MLKKKYFYFFSISAFLLSGCGNITTVPDITGKKEVFNKDRILFKDFDTRNNFSYNSTVLLNKNQVQSKKFIVLDYERNIKDIINELSKIKNITYFFEGTDIILPKSNFKIRNIYDLMYYVSETTNFRLILEDKKKNKNVFKIYKLKLVPKNNNNNNYKFVIVGKTTLYHELYKLAKKNIQLSFEDKIKNKPLYLSINTNNVNTFINIVCNTADIWCDLDGNNILHIRKYKPFNIFIPIDAKFSIKLGQGSVKGSTDSNGKSTGSRKTLTNVNDFISYNFQNLDYRSYIKELAKTLGIKKITVFKGKTGYIEVLLSPRTYRKLMPFFEAEKRLTENVNVEIDIIRVDLSNDFQYGINWNKFLMLSKNANLQIKSNFINNSQDNSGIVIEARKDSVKKGILTLLKNFGDVHKVSSWNSNVLTGHFYPFANYRNIRYVTLKAIPNKNGKEPIIATELHQDVVGFKGGIVINKYNGKYRINGFITESAVSGYYTTSVYNNIVRIPNIDGKTIKIGTDISSLNRTILLGGYIVKGIQNSENSTPIIDKIPAFNLLFKNKTDLSRNSQFLIFLTLKPTTELK